MGMAMPNSKDNEFPSDLHASFFHGSFDLVKEPEEFSNETAEKVLAAVERLERKIDLIFGDNVILDGRFVSLGRLNIKLNSEEHGDGDA